MIFASSPPPSSPTASSSSPHRPCHRLRTRILLHANLFAPACLNFRRNLPQPALNLNLPHGLSLCLTGSTNIFVLHFLAVNQIWVFTAQLPGDRDDDAVGSCHSTIDLMKCAVIDLVLLVYVVTVLMGSLLVGEGDGVRFFPLRPLIKRKGRVARRNDLGEKTLKGY